MPCWRGPRASTKGKTKIWNQVGIQPLGCEMLERLARVVDQHAHVWRGPGLPTHLQGLQILGTHSDHVRAYMDRAAPRQPNAVGTGFHCSRMCKRRGCSFALRVIEPASASSVTSTTKECGHVWRPSCKFDSLMLGKLRILGHCP